MPNTMPLLLMLIMDEVEVLCLIMDEVEVLCCVMGKYPHDEQEIRRGD